LDVTSTGVDALGRIELKEALSEAGESDPALQALANSFSEMTPAQKAWGKLIGKLLESRGSGQVEDSFSWFAVEHNGGAALSPRDRMLALFQAAECLGCEEAHYRLIRRMFILANHQ
jgi:hypothetical protein